MLENSSDPRCFCLRLHQQRLAAFAREQKNVKGQILLKTYARFGERTPANERSRELRPLDT